MLQVGKVLGKLPVPPDGRSGGVRDRRRGGRGGAGGRGRVRLVEDPQEAPGGPRPGGGLRGQEVPGQEGV